MKMTKELFAAEEDSGSMRQPPVAPAPENDVETPLGKKKLELVWNDDDDDGDTVDAEDRGGGGGDGGVGDHPSGAAAGGGGHNPIRTMIHARERELSAITGAKQTLLADELRETRLELEDRNEKFHALRDDFHYNLRLLRVRARAAGGGERGARGWAGAEPFSLPSLDRRHTKKFPLSPSLPPFPPFLRPEKPVKP